MNTKHFRYKEHHIFIWENNALETKIGMRTRLSILIKQFRLIMHKTLQEKKLQIYTSKIKNTRKQSKFIGKFIKIFRQLNALSC